MPNYKGYQTRLTAAQKRKIRSLYRQGVHWERIIKRFGCSHGALWSIVRGLPLALRQKRHAVRATKFRKLGRAALGWVAGILDGEGWVGISHRRGGGAYYQPRIIVSSTTPVMQRRLHKLLGGHYYRHRRIQPRCRAMWSWSLWTVEEIQALLAVVGPLLVVKRRQAQVVDRFCRRRLASDTRNARSLKLDHRDWRRALVLNRRGSP